MATTTPTDVSDTSCGREKGDYHPLETIPYFRRFKPGIWRDVAYTFIWSAVLGVAFWLMAITISPRSRSFEYFVFNQMIAQSIGYSIHALFELGGLLGIDARVRRAGWWAKTLYYSLVSTAGVLVGFFIPTLVLDPTMFENWLKNPHMLGTMAGASMMVSVVLSVILLQRERRARVEADLQSERLRTERIERESVLANLRALQAQIEPHFLFNTLANVASLIDPDPAKARRMLESFNRFLRSSLAATRTESTTLAAEADLITAYLEVLQVRMQGRLRFSIDVPGEVESFTLPPMLLQPVVENAIRHGLEPKLEGGEVKVRAGRDGGRVVVEVSDTGVGFAPTTHGGVGLTNLRERLRLLYDGRASLDIAEAPGGGTLVRVALPA
jgi:signal transduction histidine kinase